MSTTTAEIERVRAIARVLDGLTNQLAELATLESIGARLELRLAYASLSGLDEVPMPDADLAPPLPRADIVAGIEAAIGELEALPAQLRLSDPVMTALTAARTARSHLR